MESLTNLTSQIKAIDEEISNLKEQKEELKAQILERLKSSKGEKEVVDCGEQSYTIARVIKHKVHYKEDVLKQRLGEQYKTILKPEYRRFKAHIEEATPFLMPIMDKIGSVSQDIVKEKIETGALDPSVFKGAFEKEEKENLSIRKVNPMYSASDDMPY